MFPFMLSLSKHSESFSANCSIREFIVQLRSCYGSRLLHCHLRLLSRGARDALPRKKRPG